MTSQQQHEKLLLACQRLAGSLHAEEALSGIVYALFDVAGASAAAVVLRDASSGQIAVKSCRGLSASFCQQFVHHSPQKAVMDVIDGQHEVFLDDGSADPGLAAALWLEGQPASLACVPIITPGRSVGYVYVARQSRRAFSDDDRTWVRVFASLAAAAVDRDEMVRLRHEQPVDPETQIYAFHYFARRLAEEVERGRRLSRPTSVLLMEIDRFEGFENVHGHEKAAALFGACVNGIRASLRQIDLLGRFGRNQLVACLVETTPREAEIVVERLIEKVAGVLPAGHKGLRLRTGTAGIVRDGQQAMDLLEEAQRNLHRGGGGGGDAE